MIIKREKCFLGGGYDIFAAEDKSKPMVKIGHIRKRPYRRIMWMYSSIFHPQEQPAESMAGGIKSLVALALLAK